MFIYIVIDSFINIKHFLLEAMEGESDLINKTDNYLMGVKVQHATLKHGKHWK